LSFSLFKLFDVLVASHALAQLQPTDSSEFKMTNRSNRRRKCPNGKLLLCKMVYCKSL